MCFLAFTFNFPGQEKEKQDKNVRKPAVAGSFYPADKAALEELVHAFLNDARPPAIQAPIRAIMVPHAGYVYSGPVAAYAYQAFRGRDIRTVILIGNSHRHYLNGIAVYKQGRFQTPLGLVPIDEEKTQKLLAASPKIMDRPDIHGADHVLEVQLPFLQTVLKDFKIVPLLFGNDSPELATVLANALKDILDDKTLIVASTDMSHYPSYQDATTADHLTLQAITSGKAETLDATLQQLAGKGIPNTETFLCGASGVRTVLLLTQALAWTNPVLLKYANSGDSPVGDKSRVVGYGAVAFVGEQNKSTATVPAVSKENERAQNNDEKVVTAQEEIELLKLAQFTVENYLRTKKVPSYSPKSSGLRQKLGAFVTLKENGNLRGCIGRFEPDAPLFLVVQQMALAAATEDPRFRPVSPAELGKLTYEISVLSPLRKIRSADEIVLGKHGVQVSKWLNSGVFLPQVATETGWTKEEFLRELCSQKAGLPADCWKDPKVTLQVFTAQVFSEEKK